MNVFVSARHAPRPCLPPARHSVILTRDGGGSAGNHIEQVSLSFEKDKKLIEVQKT
jgi:hypothetical protein